MTPTPATAFAVAVTCALAILPGLAVLKVCRAAPRDIIERVGLAVGMGLALVPLIWLLFPLYMTLYPRHVLLTGGSWWMLLLVSGIVVAGRYLVSGWPFGLGLNVDSVGRSTADGADGEGDEQRVRSGFTGRRAPIATPTIALALVLAVQLTARWYAARAVTIPIWADSVHHTMIAELFVRHGRLPDSWLPLAQLATFSYHFGFHAVVAAVAQTTGLPTTRAVVVVGQVLMVLQSLTVAGLAAGWTRRPWAGVVAAIVVGGLGPMPGTYLTWGRYTQLAGQVVLPAAILATVRAARGPVRLDDEDDSVRRVVGRIVAAAIIVAGLALTHYVVTAFFAVAVGAWWLVDGGEGRRGRAAGLARMAVVAAFAITLALPWLPHFLAGNIDRNASALVSTELPGAVWGAVSISYVLDHFGQWVGVALTTATLLAIAVGLLRRDRVAAIATVWMAGLVAASYPQAFGLPITGPLKDFTVLIGLYVPASVAIGAAVGRTIDVWLARRTTHPAAPPAHPALGDVIDDIAGWFKRPSSHVVIASVALAALLGWRQRDVIQSDHVIATSADEAALAWVKANTPPDAVFLASGAPTYGDTVVLGDDGGWWLPVLADRACTIPPLPIGHEVTVQPDYRQRTVDLAKAVAADLGAPATVALLRREGVGWAYVGPTAKALTVGKLEAAGGWRRVYDKDGASVWVAGWGGSGGEGLPQAP